MIGGEKWICGLEFSSLYHLRSAAVLASIGEAVEDTAVSVEDLDDSSVV
jgi:hypothetical protein